MCVCCVCVCVCMGVDARRRPAHKYIHTYVNIHESSYRGIGSPFISNASSTSPRGSMALAKGMEAA